MVKPATAMASLALSLIAGAGATLTRESIEFAQQVPLQGRTLLTNFNPSNSTSITNAKSSFPSIIDSLYASEKLSKTNMTFSIDVFSTSNNKSIYSFHHAAPGLNGTLTSGKLDDESIYRVGSVSKLFTAYAILNTAGIGVFDEPVTRYLPQLAGNQGPGKIVWEDVTIGALASQQAGAGGGRE